MRVAVDTNVLVSAAGWGGNERDVIRKAMDGRITLIVGDEVLQEFDSVIRRDKFSFLEGESIESFIALMAYFSEIVHPSVRLDTIVSDPDDNRVLEAAIEGKADLIVSGDRHLLRLKEFRGIRIVTSSQLLHIIDKEKG